MKIYKLKHIPTGLYYIPSRGNGNLSIKGKIYSSKPKIEWGLTLKIKIFSFKKIPTGKHKIITDYFKLDWNNGFVDKYVKTNIEDWEIIEIN